MAERTMSTGGSDDSDPPLSLFVGEDVAIGSF